MRRAWPSQLKLHIGLWVPKKKKKPQNYQASALALDRKAQFSRRAKTNMDSVPHTCFPNDTQVYQYYTYMHTSILNCMHGMCMYVVTYVFLYISQYINKEIKKQTNCTCMSMCTNMYVYILTYPVDIRSYTHTYVCISSNYIYIYIYMYIRSCVYIYICICPATCTNRCANMHVYAYATMMTCAVWMYVYVA